MYLNDLNPYRDLGPAVGRVYINRDGNNKIISKHTYHTDILVFTDEI